MSEQLVTIAVPGGLSAGINPLGAELWWLRDAEGRDLMTDADPAFWTGHAPLLFPIVGTLAGDRYRLPDGRVFDLPRHGFARRRLFEAASAGADSALFTLASDAETRAVYPFDFHLSVRYAVEGETFRMVTEIGNLGDSPMPFSLGYHPAFAWPLPYGADKSAHRLTFAQPEPGPVRRLDAASGLLTPDPHPTPVEGRTLAPTAAMFEADALIWTSLESRSVVWGAPGTPGLRIDFPDMDALGLWQKPGARYLCIEPWAGYADPVGFTGTIWDKPGILRLEPGESRAFRMDVTLVRG